MNANATMKDPSFAERDQQVGGLVLDRASLAEDLRKLSVVSNWKSAWAIAEQWLVIALAGWGAVRVGHWAAYVLAIFIIATRQHALYALLHDATHYRIFTHRTANDALGNLLLGYPLGLGVAQYRFLHFLHHRYLNTDQDLDWVSMHMDEDWRWPKLQWQCLKLFIKDFVGLNGLKLFKILAHWSPLPKMVGIDATKQGLARSEFVLIATFGIVTLIVLYQTHGWLTFFILWIVPMITFLSAIFRIRGASEHLAVENEMELNATRHVTPTFLEKLIIAPLNTNYHLAHHLFPLVPFYNLPKLHKRLMQEDVFRQKAHLTKSYTGLKNGVLAELLLPAKRARS